MPRGRKNNRGGPRMGTVGKAYGQRTDLNAPKPKLMAIPGQAYGKQAEQLEAQRTVPMAAQPSPGGLMGALTASDNFDGTQAAGLAGSLDRPTESPDEPITAGAPFGPGANQLMAPEPDSQDLQDLAQYLPALEIMASQPNVSVAGRNFVRRIRGAVPTLQAPPPQVFTDEPAEPMVVPMSPPTEPTVEPATQQI